MDHRSRLLELQSLLDAHQDLWRASPFHIRHPTWGHRWPALAEAVLELDDDAVERLSDDPLACRAWLAPRLPVAEALGRLGELPPLPARPLPPCDAHFDWEIPGRKRAQIEAFVAHGPETRTPLLEWCAGKGHLGRRAALADRVPVSSLELVPALCEEASRLAARARVVQTVLRADALEAASQAHVRERTVLALHACGELHRTLVRAAAGSGADGYRIAPCCYHHGADDGYRPLSPLAHLPLDSGALRLAVTETVTAPRRARRRLAQDQAWKLGFIALRNELEGDAVRPFRPVPSQWLSSDFPAYCRALAEREGVRLPAAVDYAHWLTVGLRRRAEVRRYALVRHAFRRPLETWLVMDIALGLEEAGYRVRAGTFCERSLTPRNLMVLAS